MNERIEIKLTFSDLSLFVGNRSRMQSEGEAILAAGHVVRGGGKDLVPVMEVVRDLFAVKQNSRQSK